MQVEILSAINRETFTEHLQELVTKYDKKGSTLNELMAQKDKKGGQRLALVIDGPTLGYAFESPHALKAFFRLGLLSASVICCRVSPKQKAEVVGLAK